MKDQPIDEEGEQYEICEKCAVELSYKEDLNRLKKYPKLVLVTYLAHQEDLNLAFFTLDDMNKDYKKIFKKKD